MNKIFNILAETRQEIANLVLPEHKLIKLLCCYLKEKKQLLREINRKPKQQTFKNLDLVS